MENVLFNEECREKLIKGINLAAKVAQVTFGPNGHTVLGGQHPTKDGMTAISWLYDSDPYVNTGINLMKELTAKTAEVAGDNTTTTALLANEIITKCNTSDSKQLKESLDLVIKYLQSQKRIIKSFQDLVNVATLAANGDEHIGELVAEAFAKVKEDGVVTFSESEDVFDRVDYSQGFRITNGFSSPKFINTPQGTCELTDVYVHISDTKMEEITEVVNIADKCMKMHKSLLLMAPDFDSEIYVFLQSNLDLLKSCTVISPAFKAHRDILVKDIKALLGDSQICQKVVLTQKDTTFIGYQSSAEVEDIIKSIREILDTKALSQPELDFHKKRLANFTSGIATIFIGGLSQPEIKEKLDRVEDAVRATDCAVREGILPGGGITLAKVAEKLPEGNPLKEVLTLPMRLLGTNLDQKNELIKKGIVEPYLVVKTALENAVNMAILIMTCDCIILPKFYDYEK